MIIDKFKKIEFLFSKHFQARVINASRRLKLFTILIFIFLILGCQAGESKKDLLVTSTPIFKGSSQGVTSSKHSDFIVTFKPNASRMEREKIFSMFEKVYPLKTEIIKDVEGKSELTYKIQKNKFVLKNPKGMNAIETLKMIKKESIVQDVFINSDMTGFQFE